MFSEYKFGYYQFGSYIRISSSCFWVWKFLLSNQVLALLFIAHVESAMSFFFGCFQYLPFVFKFLHFYHDVHRYMGFYLYCLSVRMIPEAYIISFVSFGTYRHYLFKYSAPISLSSSEIPGTHMLDLLIIILKFLTVFFLYFSLLLSLCVFFYCPQFKYICVLLNCFQFATKPIY